MVRRLLSGVVFVVCVGISVAAAFQALWHPLPAGRAAAPLDLEEWITRRDLTQADPGTRRRVFLQLEQELRRDSAWLGRLKEADVTNREQFHANLAELARLWYREEVVRYFDQPPDQREEYLDEQLDRLELFVQMAAPDSTAGERFLGTIAALGWLGQHVPAWIEEAEPPLQERMRQFQQALSRRIVARGRGWQGFAELPEQRGDEPAHPGWERARN